MSDDVGDPLFSTHLPRIDRFPK